MRRLLPGRPVAAPRLPQALGGRDDQPVFGSQFSQLALPLVAVILLDASAFECRAPRRRSSSCRSSSSALPAGVWVDRLRRKPILVIGDLGPRASARLDSARVRVRRAHDLAALRRRLRSSASARSSSTSPTSRTSRRSSSATSSSRATRSSRSAARRHSSPARAPRAPSSSALGAPVAVLLDAISFVALGGLPLPRSGRRRRCPSRTPSARRAGHAGGGSRGPALGARQPLPARDLGLHRRRSNFFGSMIGALFVVYAVRELGLSARLRSGSPSRSATVGPLLAAFTTGRISNRLRRRADDHHRTAVLFSTSMPPPAARAEVEPAAVPRRIRWRRRLRRRRDLQHHAGQLPAGDLPRADPGTDELGDPLPRLGRDAARSAPRRRARHVVRAPRRDLGRRDRRVSSPFLPILLSPVPKLREMPEPEPDEEPLPSEAEASGGLLVAAGALRPQPTDARAAVPFGTCPSYPR